MTDENGNWSALVPAGSYRVRFDNWPAVQWAYGKESRDAADTVAVTAGGTTRVDDQMLVGSTVSGVVRTDGSKAPVEGACVQVVALRADFDDVVGESCTDGSGRYSVDVPTAGTYAALIKDPLGTVRRRILRQHPQQDQGRHVRAARGTTTTVNASLAVAASISGVAVDKVTGAPVADICPFAHNGSTGPQNPWATYDCSDSSGRWVVRGLPAGDLQPQPGRRARVPPMPARGPSTPPPRPRQPCSRWPRPRTVAVRPVKVSHGGTVAGRVTDPNGDPVAGAWVNIDSGYPGRAGPGEGRYTTQTDSQGRYSHQRGPARGPQGVRLHGLRRGSRVRVVRRLGHEARRHDRSGSARTGRPPSTPSLPRARTSSGEVVTLLG